MRLCVLIVAVCGTVACSPTFENTEASAEALSHEVLTALAQRDESRLQALALSQNEFEHHVWPALPAARPERNMPWSYLWLELQQKSRATLQRTLARHGGRHYTLEEVKFDGATTSHGAYRVLRDTRLIVRDASGDRHELRVLGAMLSSAEGWKVFSYVADE